MSDLWLLAECQQRNSPIHSFIFHTFAYNCSFETLCLQPSKNERKLHMLFKGKIVF